MTKKHLIALADAIRETKPAQDYQDGVSVIQDTQRGQYAKTVLALADFCASQNPRFNRERWLGYIAGTNGKNGGAIKS